MQVRCLDIVHTPQIVALTIFPLIIIFFIPELFHDSKSSGT